MVMSCSSSGTGYLLWPPGTQTIFDVPVDLSVAIDQAIKLESWFKNLSSEEIPPTWMWHLDWEVEQWFEEVDRARKAKYGLDDSGDDDDLDAEYSENEYADRFK